MAESTPAPAPSPTVTWKIAQLERETQDGFVFTAHYTVDAEDGTYRAGAYGSIGFQRPETLEAKVAALSPDAGSPEQ